VRVQETGSGRLSPEARRLYGRIARGDEVDVDAESGTLEELVAWRLVAVQTDRPGGHQGAPVVLDPAEAVRRHRDEGLALLAEAARNLADAPQVADELLPEFERSKWWSGPGSEFLAAPATVNARIAAAVSGARFELLTAQPGGGRTREQIDAALERDGGALARGIQLRTLYRDTVRDDVITRSYAAQMSGRGAQLRTHIGPFQRMVVIDRSQAFISDYAVNGADAHAARHVKDRGVVAFIVEVFEDVWRRSEPWQGEGRPSDDGGDGGGAPLRTTQLQREILLDAELGVLQGVTAARLGISARRLSTEVSYLREAWGAPTLAALVAKWVRSPDRALVDEDRRAGRAGSA
jgi:hypothetical protein